MMITCIDSSFGSNNNEAITDANQAILWYVITKSLLSIHSEAFIKNDINDIIISNVIASERENHDESW